MSIGTELKGNTSGSVAATASSGTELKGNISGIKLFVLGVASIVGPWLMLTSQWIGYTGVSVVLAFILCGVLCVPIGLCYGELAAVFKNKGGSYEYVSTALGRDAGYWVSWMTMFTYISLIVFQVVCVATLIQYAGGWEFSTIAVIGVVILLMLIMTFLNNRNIELAGSIQILLFSVLATVGFFFAVVFITGGDWNIANVGDLFAQGMIGYNETMGINTGFLIAVAALVTMFFGFELIPQFAGESAYPPNKCWKLMMYAMIFTVVFDSVICLAELGMPALIQYGVFDNSYEFIASLYASEGGFVSSILAKAYFGNWLSWLIIIANFCCMFACLVGFWLGGSRIIHSMGKSGSLPGKFAAVNKHGAPHMGNYTILALVFVLTMIALSGDRWINATFSMMALGCGFTYLGVSLAFVKLRRSRPNVERPWKAPGGIITGILAACSSLFMVIMMVYTQISTAMNGDYTMGLMTVIYLIAVLILYIYTKQNQKKHPELYPTVNLLPANPDAVTTEEETEN